MLEKGNEALYHSNFSSFAEGFTQGYLTMDAIAAIAFSMIVVNAVKLTGITKTNQIFKTNFDCWFNCSNCFNFHIYFH